MIDNTLRHGGSPERFGYSWAIYDKILPIHQEQFRRWTSALSSEAWAGAEVLDVGCGIGRNSFWALEAGAKRVLAIDVDERSLGAAKRNLAGKPQAEVRELSVYDVNENDAFDIVFSIGVIHHLTSPEQALLRMKAAAKPGGKVLIWVYGRENNGWLIYFFDPLRRGLLSRLPLSVVYHLSLYPTALLWALLRIGFDRIEYLRLLRSFSFSHVRAIVFDQMIPRIAHYWPREFVEALMNMTGLKDVRLVWVNEMSWSAVGTKPEANSSNQPATRV